MNWVLCLLLAAVPFRFDPAAKKISIWGRGAELPRVYFDEKLPALFERTLLLEHFDPGDGALQWIFTGDRAGFTVEIDRARVRVFERYYDSFGLVDKPARHPERITADAIAPLNAAPRRVTVTLDHRLGLAVTIDGRQLLHQTCLFDVHRHQLAFTGKQGKIEGSLEQPEPGEATIHIDPSRRYQTMLGFGGITTPMAFRELSAEGQRRWWQYLRDYNLLLHREYPMGARLAPDMHNLDDPKDASPHYYGDNFPNGEITDFEYIKQVRRIGGGVLYEFWDLPPWARDPDSYAHAMVRYCEISKERAGAPPDIVGIQNERTQPAETWHRMTLRLRAELDRAGFRGVKIHMQDASTVGAGIASARAFRNSPPVWAALDFTASHMYDYQKFLPDPDGFDALLKQWSEAAMGKPFLSTEISVNQAPWQVSSYRLALSMGQLYHKNLTLANASALLYCWLLLNVEQPSYGWTRSLFVPDHAHGSVPVPSSNQLRVFGAYSRRIRAGMVRVEASSSNPDLLVTAFEGKDGRVLIILNRATRPLRVRANWSFHDGELVDPYDENTPQPSGDIRIEPGAILTLSQPPA